ncbi:MAG: OmpA family protein [Flavobacteriaceae bacterium]
MKQLYPTIFIWVLTFQGVVGQNLVANPSFEQFGDCPSELGNVARDVADWNMPTKGSTDYFNVCSSRLGIPENFNGIQEAQFGDGYAGFYMLAPNNYREYIQGKLTGTLREGERYGVSFYVSLAEKSKYAVRDFGILFSENPVEEDTKKHFSNAHLDPNFNKFNFLEVSERGYFKDMNDWMLVYGEFVSKGTENYLTIGNFRDDTRTNTKKAGGMKSASYYYIDMVSVVPVYEPPEFNELRYDRVYTLRDVHFSTNSFALNPTSREELDRLYNRLRYDPTLYITVHAHTDTDGTAQYNRALSSKRAKAVTDYMVAKGLPKGRIRYLGHGFAEPVASNDTKEGKQMNRRAEFVITQGSFDNSTYLTETMFEDEN